MKVQRGADDTMVTVSRAGLINMAVVTVGMIMVTLVIHASYITQMVQRGAITFARDKRLSKGTVSIHGESSVSSGDLQLGAGGDLEFMTERKTKGRIPEMFIFRRTKKSGSSSMLPVLFSQLETYGYHALYYEQGEEMDATVRNEYLQSSPRRLFIAEHNHVTKSFHPDRQAVVIADTIRDGYEQMTSYCRYVRKVRTCNSALVSCLRSSEALSQIKYRWAARRKEDDDTYIDFPLSSSHPALSTTILRTVYPNVTLDISSRFNVKGTTCPEVTQLREAYNELYGDLDEQVMLLKRRMLVIAGYPYHADRRFKDSLTLDRMLDEAELIEKTKYELSKGTKKRGYSDPHHELIRTMKHWSVDKDGKPFIKSRRN